MVTTARPSNDTKFIWLCGEHLAVIACFHAFINDPASPEFPTATLLSFDPIRGARKLAGLHLIFKGVWR